MNERRETSVVRCELCPKCGRARDDVHRFGCVLDDPLDDEREREEDDDGE